MLLIDEESIYWVKFPEQTHPSDYITYDFDNKPKLYLNSGLKFDYKILTGIQLFSKNSGITLKVFGQSIIDSFMKSQLNETVYDLTGPTEGKIINGYGAGLSSKRTYFTVKSEGSINFDWSTEKSDAGQSFVPYFDGNDVIFDYSAPLSGIRLVHYTNDEEYGGFIRPIISTMDYKSIFEMKETDLI